MIGDTVQWDSRFTGAVLTEMESCSIDLVPVEPEHPTKLRCLHCDAEWEVNSGGNLHPFYWLCPDGCNAGEHPDIDPWYVMYWQRTKRLHRDMDC